MSKYKFGKRSKKNMEGLQPELVEVLETALNFGVMDFSVIGGARTIEEQAELYALGRTRPGKVVTWTLNSRHIGGFAFDVAPYPLDWNDYNKFSELAGVIKSAAAVCAVELEWGVDLWGKDYPHFQLKE